MYKKLMELDENEEIVESEELINESIKSLKQWAQNHRSIKGIDMSRDDVCLQFLRARRFSVASTQELIERCCIFIKKHPELFDFSEENYKTMMELYETNFITVVNERDARGRRIILCKTSRIDTKKFNIDDVMRLFSFILLVIIDEEKTQQNGTVFVNDLSGLSAARLRLFPYKMLANFSSFINVSVVRVKGIFVIGLPPFAVNIFKAIRLVLNEKLQKRLHVMSDSEKLWNYVDRRLIPREYEGEGASVNDALEDFRKVILEKRDKILECHRPADLQVERADSI